MNIWITIDILFELITNLHFIIISATKETRREGEVKKPPKVYKNVLDRFKQWTQIPSSTWAEPCYFFSFFQMTKMRLLTNKDNLNSLKGVVMCQQPWAFSFLCQILSHYMFYLYSKTLAYGRKTGF